MDSPRRASEWFLILGFLGILAAVPLVQIGLELHRRERVQFVDLFRYAPTQSNLRRYERTLEDKSWARQAMRPAAQELLFAALGDTGPQALLGREGWLFYRPGVRYLVEGDQPEVSQSKSLWVEPESERTRYSGALEAILHYRGQLKERGIELLVMPVPEKASVYPDLLTRWADAQQFRSPSEKLLDDLRRAGVPTVDLFALFRQARGSTSSQASGEAFYLSSDTHWTPAGAELAARAVAAEIRRLGLAPQYPRTYQAATVQVQRSGDIVELMQVPGLRDHFPDQQVACSQITDKIVGLMAPRAGDQPGFYMNSHLKDTPLEPSILLLGDSFCRIYQLSEPKSLGEMEGRQDAGGGSGEGKTAKRYLPGSAGFPSLLAQAMQSPVDYIISDGGAATDVRRRLALQREILENKKIVVWEFTERDLGLGSSGWQEVDLPPEL